MAKGWRRVGQYAVESADGRWSVARVTVCGEARYLVFDLREKPEMRRFEFSGPSFESAIAYTASKARGGDETGAMLPTQPGGRDRVTTRL